MSTPPARRLVLRRVALAAGYADAEISLLRRRGHWSALQRVLGTFDGQVKYGRLLRPGQHAGDAVFAEKQREDALRDGSWGVVRRVWAHLETPEGLVARVLRALERGAR